MSRGRDEQLGDAEVVQSGSVPFYSKETKGSIFDIPLCRYSDRSREIWLKVRYFLGP